MCEYTQTDLKEVTIMHDIDHYVPEMLALRREIHQRPEEGWTEFETTSIVVTTLESLGFKVKAGKEVIAPEAVMGRDPVLVEKALARAREHGVSEALLERLGGYTGAVATLETGRPGPVTAFRFDMDCVLVEESEDAATHEPARKGYCSVFPGLMHACGHDAHTATGLALAYWLMDHREALNGTIKLIFQPAEEGTRGAAAMAAAGVVDDVDWFFGAHVGAGARLGEVAVIRKGFMATTKMDLVFKGTPSHAGAEPEKGHSALLAAAHCAVALAGIPRHGGGMTRIAIGTLHAGEGRNVTPVHAKMQIEVRGENDEINSFMVKKVESIVAGVAAAFEVEAKIIKVGEATNMVASPEACDVVAKVAGRMPDVKLRFFDQGSGSEDCCTLIRRAQSHGAKAGFFFYGCDTPGHHRSDFEIQDEISLPVALKMLVGIVEELNK